MPSVGAILFGLRADVDSLKSDLDKANADLAKFAKDGARQTKELEKGFESAGHGVEGYSHIAKQSFKNVAAGILLMTDAAKDAGPIAGGLTHIFGAWMVGGPIAAGVMAVSEAFKIFGESAHDAAKETEELRKKDISYLDELKKKTKEMQEETQKLRDEIQATNETAAGKPTTARDVANRRDIGAMQSQLAQDKLWLMRIREEIADAEKTQRDILARNPNGVGLESPDLDPLMAAAREYRELKGKEKVATTEIATLEKAVAEAKALQVALGQKIAQDTDDTVRLTKEWLDELDKALKRQEQIDETVEGMLRKYREQKEMAEATSQQDEDRLAATKAMDDALQAGADIIQATQVYEAALAASQAQHARENIALANRTQEAWQKAEEARAKASAERASSANDSIEHEIQLLYAVTDEQRKQVELARKIAQLRNDGADGEKIAALEAATAWRDSYEAQREGQKRLQESYRSFTSTVESGLTDALVAAATEGGAQFADILKNVMINLQRDVAQSLSHLAVGALSSLFGGGSSTSSGGIGGILQAAFGIGGAVLSGTGGGGLNSTADGAGPFGLDMFDAGPAACPG